MGGVAVYSTRLAREVGAQLDFVVAHYLPGYGAVGEADVRTVEQALALRRLIIANLETPDDRAAIEAHHAAFVAKGRETEADLTRARRHVAVELQDRSGLSRRGGPPPPRRPSRQVIRVGTRAMATAAALGLVVATR
jgi:adenylate cyclase